MESEFIEIERKESAEDSKEEKEDLFFKAQNIMRLQKAQELFNCSAQEVFCIKFKLFAYGRVQPCFYNPPPQGEQDVSLFYTEGYCPPCRKIDEFAYLVCHETGPEFLMRIERRAKLVASIAESAATIAGSAATIIGAVNYGIKNGGEVMDRCSPYVDDLKRQAKEIGAILKVEIRNLEGKVAREFNSLDKKEIEAFVKEYLETHGH